MDAIGDFGGKEFALKGYVENIVQKVPPLSRTASQDGMAFAADPTAADHVDLLPFISTLEGKLAELAGARADIDQRLNSVTEKIDKEASFQLQHDLLPAFSVLSLNPNCRCRSCLEGCLDRKEDGRGV